ncbi:aldehyde dehydrogenase [Arthrobacter sp. FW306-2-2C-D06B]|uniref:aldehyde dehydrogenase n=1 Tax=Arthrobacter sp. FW306-2-2C-D06B TaxID=2879618 RepID=UPI001F2F2479|nr:aldehyde dehydrogenase [Arthrobacter sp. FW306-2-2C-D06B]UKA60473.1 aldehyde dehydrogenase [Arthrobacter sp. FW306-2-2C-D06B]
MTWSGRYDQLFIGGAWVSPTSSEKIAVVSPATEEVIASVPSSSHEDMNRAVAAARDAFDRGPWPRLPLEDRVAVLERFRAIYALQRETFAELITSEMGCPITLSRTIQATTPLMVLDTFLEVVREYPFSAIRRSANGAALVTREPVGVVAAIVPWNVPQSIIMQKLVPALLAGCTMVIKPAPETPLDAYLLAELLQEAGLPSGVVNIIPADREVSESLVTHPGVDKVSFTGSTLAGRRIASLCGQNLKRVTLELGGKSAAIILDDADLEMTVESLRFASLRNSGQVCSLKTRLVVSRHREQELLERLAALVASMPVGDPQDPATQIGPMVSERQRGNIERYIEAGIAEGARAVVGGRPRDSALGWYVEPTIFADVRPDMSIAQEEIFGPVLSVIPYVSVEEAISIANDSIYGLNGAVFTSDLDHGLSVASKLRTGTVELNGSPAGLRAPMGGFKASGIGREAGPEGIDPYVEIRSIGLPSGFATVLEDRASAVTDRKADVV